MMTDYLMKTPITSVSLMKPHGSGRLEPADLNTALDETVPLIGFSHSPKKRNRNVLGLGPARVGQSANTSILVTEHAWVGQSANTSMLSNEKPSLNVYSNLDVSCHQNQLFCTPFLLDIFKNYSLSNQKINIKNGRNLH